ncbi:MAG: bifunctional DNA-formamidopyrimidine glycosylase/DNA-(apurinic or apyrimidinic site) lyase [Phycicoccus sp.]|nr:bifunctional DNA-formamidopyrimidine glycosylase/DNA-(apurinic or apyrimidinic site) lyase [Phycicoccus sp.]
MPELPEVEVVRLGLAEHVAGRRIAAVELRGHRVARRHLPGPADLVSRLVDRHIQGAYRRGKYLWLALADGALAPDEALLLHLGMSGQLLVSAPDTPEPRHLHARFAFADDGPELRFVDQRTFGGVAHARLAPDGVPVTIAHLARDPFDPAFDQRATVEAMRAKDSAIKRVLLDQRVVSGIGNIYADEALWRARVHGARPASSLTRPTLHGLVDHARDVMTAALGQGGTSFDALYVNVNGASGYFDRSLHAYGREGEPCDRCGTPMGREAFMNRSSFFCPRCQKVPRRVAVS